MGSLKLTTASSGSVILSPANTASDVTITVPAVTGTMLTTATAGTVLQVVNATSTTETSASGSWVDTGLSATITPSSSTSKILVIVDQAGLVKTAAADTSAGLRLLRNSTALAQFEYNVLYTASASNLRCGGSGVNYLDSPATTSATTYKTQIQNQASAGYVAVSVSGSVGSITLMEIAA